FGFRRGSFTGAVGESGGLVSEAGGGTLFLDELSTLPAPAQVKLLRVLETHQVRRVGDTTGRAVDFRVVGAVHEDLGLAVKRGEFRQDLFQRLAGLVISLPPLSERQEDIYPLAERFAAAMGRRLGPGVEAVLRRHRWVGNVRELRASIERSAFLSSAVELPPAVIAESIHLGSVPCAEELTLRLESERERLVQAMRESEGDPAEAAAKLGVSRSTVYRRLRAHGLAQPWISGAL
ncbi:MAG TPA: sigma 54-interacting transcriptional regulator, partial [Gemmatimonadales bacterium]|nr:sigma 54-interacting transcriptional regulator [Gemmatimonadales bacterium]